VPCKCTGLVDLERQGLFRGAHAPTVVVALGGEAGFGTDPTLPGRVVPLNLLPGFELTWPSRQYPARW
jgi:hypothetical protein